MSPILDSRSTLVRALLSAALLAAGCTETSRPEQVATVEVVAPAGELTVGDSAQLMARVWGSAGSVMEGQAVVWASADTTVATVSGAGKVKAVGLGTTTVRASAGGKDGRVSLTVRPVPVASVAVEPGQFWLQPGDSVLLTAVVKDASGNSVSGRTVSWTASPDSVLRVSSSGWAWGIRVGSAMVTATVEGKSGEAVGSVAATEWVRHGVGTARTLRGVWTTGPNHAWVVGESGTILRYDGIRWTEMSHPLRGTTTGFNGVWGTGPDNVFVVGGAGVILHYDGAAWRQMASGTTQFLTSVWGSSPTNVYAVGHGVILRYDGTAWSTMQAEEGVIWTQVWGRSATEVYVGGGDRFSVRSGYVRRYDGTAWHLALGAGRLVESVWAASPTGVYACTSAAGMLFHDGISTRSLGLPVSGCNSLWGGPPRRVFAVGYGTPFVFDGTRWRSMTFPTNLQASLLYAISGSSATNVFAVGEGGVVIQYRGP